MQEHIFRNMDGMHYSNFVDVFEELKQKENLLVRDFCLDSYRFVLGKWVYHRLCDALHDRFGFEMERLTKSCMIMGVTFVVSEDIDPNTVRLEKKPPAENYFLGNMGHRIDDSTLMYLRRDVLDSMRYAMDYTGCF